MAERAANGAGAHRPYRVIQWGTGQCGRMVIEAIHTERPGLELVAAKVFADEKAGQDIGEIAGIGPIGVIAAKGEEEVLAVDADCVLWMGTIPLQEDHGVSELCRILASGKNAISLAHTWYMAPGILPPELVEPIEEACREGNSSLYATGMEPGFVNEVVAPILTSLTSRVDYLEMRELLTYDQWISPMLFSVMPFGQPLGEGTLEFMEAMNLFFHPNIAVAADAIGAEIGDISYEWDVAPSPESFDVPAGHVAEGTIGALRFAWTGYDATGTARVKTEHINRLRDDIAPDWKNRGVDGHGYDVTIEGDPSMYLALDFRDETARPAVQTALYVTAMRAMNAVPAVCDAPPGILTARDVPLIAARYPSARALVS